MTDYAPALHVLCKWVWLKKKAEKKKTPKQQDVVWHQLKQATWQYHEWSRADISLIGMLLYKK